MANAIRPPDPLVTMPTLAVAPYGSAEATRRLLHLAYRDCTTVLDLTWGKGGFWATPPPGIVKSINAWPNHGESDVEMRLYSADYTVPSDWSRIPKHDLVVFDPPHVADAGEGGLYKARYGTVQGTLGLVRNVEAGLRAAAALCDVGVLVKVTDSSHGGYWLGLGDHVKIEAGKAGLAPYCEIITYRHPTVDPKWTKQRAPRSNGARYIAFRFDPRHRDFDREYASQEKVRAARPDAHPADGVY